MYPETEVSRAISDISKDGIRMELPVSYEPQVFELTAFCDYLLRSPFVRQATLRCEMPTIEQTYAILTAIGLMQTRTHSRYLGMAIYL